MQDIKNERSLELKDTFGRKHDYLRISLTEKCNLRCTYCMPENGIDLKPSSHLMNTEEILKIANSFVDLGVRKIRLTGGEPLVRKEFSQILMGLTKLGVELGISTNGILVDRFIPTFKAAGLNKINVSLDTLDPTKFFEISRRHEFDKVISNLQLLLNSNFEVKLNVVLMRGFNDDEIIDFIEMTKHQNLVVRFIEFMPFKDNKWDARKMMGLDEILSIAEDRYSSDLFKTADDAHDTTKHYKVHNYKGSWGVISTVTSPFCSGCNRMRITADGKIKNCLFSNQEIDLLSELRMGNDVKPLIEKSVLAKKAVRAGMDTIDKFGNIGLNSDNRSMIAIGG